MKKKRSLRKLFQWKINWNFSDKFITRITNLFALMIVLVLVGWGIGKLYEEYKYEFTNDAQVNEYINPIVARVGGFIVDVRFVDNQEVKKGDTLLIIDSKEYIFEALQQAALLDREDANIAVINSEKAIQLSKNEAIQKKIEAQRAKVWKQQLEYERYVYLHEHQSTTSQKLENVQAELEVLKSELLSLEHELMAGNERLQDYEVRKLVVDAEKKRLAANLGRKSLDVAYTVIVAPYNGRVGKRSIEVGQMINPGQVLGHIINDETPTWVVANYKETQIRNIQMGDEVEVVADAYPDEVFKGKVISLAPATGSAFSLMPPDNATGNFVKIVQRVPVRIELHDIDARKLLRSGMNVNVWIPKN